MDQHYSSAGQPAGPPRPAAPKPVLTAAKFMYWGAAVSAAELVGVLPFLGDIHGRALGHPFTPTPLTATVVTASFLLPVALWLWMARAASQGRNWARILCTALFALATLQLTGSRGVVPMVTAALTWLTGLAVVWLLWRPACSAFFQAAALGVSSAVVFSAVPALPGQDGGVRAASSRRGSSWRRHYDDPGASSAAPGRIWT